MSATTILDLAGLVHIIPSRICELMLPAVVGQGYEINSIGADLRRSALLVTQPTDGLLRNSSGLL